MTYPNDDTGDALRRLEADGDDLRRPRDIDFNVSMPSETAAEHFAHHFRKAGYKVEVSFAETQEPHRWDVVVVKHMTPTHGEIIDFEEELQKIADSLGGHNDGWGCFTQNGK